MMHLRKFYNIRVQKKQICLISPRFEILPLELIVPCHPHKREGTVAVQDILGEKHGAGTKSVFITGN